MKINLLNPDSYVHSLSEKVSLTEQAYVNLSAHTDVFPYVVGKKYICVLTKEKDDYFITAICTMMKVVERFSDCDTQIQQVDLEFYNGKEIQTKRFSREIFSRNGIRELIKFGASFCEARSDQILNYLSKSDEQSKVTDSYIKLGWNTDNSVFKSGQSFGACGKYFGTLDLSPKGNIEKWLEMIKAEVIGNTPLEFALLTGFASPLLDFLNSYFDLGSILINFSNTSSKGKTTAAMLAVSIFSNPLMNKGTAITYNATDNALVQFVSQCKGHTVALDEVAMSNCNDFRKLMYTLCSGRSKLRLNADSTIKDIKEFSSIIVSTAEFNIIDDNSPEGIRTRVFELSDNLTSSAENSDNIKQAVIQNYAVAGEKFIEHLQLKKDCILKDYTECKAKLNNACKNIGAFSEIIFSKLAVILLVANYFNECFSTYNISIDIDGLKDYLLKIESNIQTQSSPEDKLIECLLQEITVSAMSYSVGNVFKLQAVGRIIENGQLTEYYILKTEFERICRKNKIDNYKQVLSTLKVRGILLCENDRLYKRIKIAENTPKQMCIGFVIKDDEQKHEHDIITHQDILNDLL